MESKLFKDQISQEKANELKSKVSFTEAIMITKSVHNCLVAEAQTQDSDLNFHDLVFLINLRMRYESGVKVSELKGHLQKEFKYKEFAKVEVMMAKRTSHLQKLGYITRDRLANDKREIEIKITPKGAEKIDDFIRRSQERWNNI